MSSRVHNHDESRKEEEEARLSSADQGAQELVARVSLQRFQKRKEGLQWASVAASSSSSHMRIVVSFVSGIRREVGGVGGKLGQFVKESKKGRFVQFLVGRAKRVGDSSGRASYGSLVLPGLLNLGSFVEARVKNLGRIRSEIPEFVARAVRQLVEDQVSRGVPRPLLASLSSSAAAPLETKHLFDVAMSTEQVARRLDGVPVYTVSNSANEFVLVSDLNSSKSLGLFCFREADASALLAQVYELNAEGIAFRFLPDPQQIKNALEARAKAGDPRKAFDGVPVFQSDNLILRTNNRRYCPIFFSKEDLENALSRAFKQQQRVNPSLRANTDIHVGSFEDVLKRMESNEEETGWGDIVFIPPGMDALKHLGKAKGTVVG
ncbi:hypothetical protein CY35_10G107000 [Sphagnum magellanicum]|nr:hypothetical protein CY35_10G107000 [Sphagnum magellanicum]